jgi:hypothetical protein
VVVTPLVVSVAQKRVLFATGTPASHEQEPAPGSGLAEEELWV